MSTRLAGVLFCLALLSACSEQTQLELPAPVPFSDEAVGHYCGMLASSHEGPKAQIILTGKHAPVFWFISVRDAITFTRSAEEPKNIAAFYVTDMTGASWANPEKGDPWIDANTAYFVIGSDRKGGMGTPEAIPFSSGEHASLFAQEYGGEVVTLAELPADYVMVTNN